MRSLMLLKLMIDLFFYGSIIMFAIVGYLNLEFEHSFLSGLLGLGLSTLHGHEYFTVSSKGFDLYSIPVISLFFFATLRVASFFVFIYQLKQMVGGFILGDLFSEKVVRNLKMAGISIIVYVILETVIESLPVFLDNRIGTTLEGTFTGFNSAWLQFTLGLLFLFMAKVFKNAKALQQENDLTI